jgi:hypothetical protein
MHWFQIDIRTRAIVFKVWLIWGFKFNSWFSLHEVIDIPVDYFAHWVPQVFFSSLEGDTRSLSKREICVRHKLLLLLSNPGR